MNCLPPRSHCFAHMSYVRLQDVKFTYKISSAHVPRRNLRIVFEDPSCSSCQLLLLAQIIALWRQFRGSSRDQTTSFLLMYICARSRARERQNKHIAQWKMEWFLESCKWEANPKRTQEEEEDNPKLLWELSQLDVKPGEEGKGNCGPKWLFPFPSRSRVEFRVTAAAFLCRFNILLFFFFLTLLAP